MSQYLLVGLASIVFLGIIAEWIAWQVRLPSILLLLLFGFIAGPITGLLNPDVMFGDLLLPVVSIAVAIILFEGGLHLQLKELRNTRSTLRNLITIGALVSFVIGTLAAYYILHMALEISLLTGAILIVTGPTVIVPLLRHLRPSGQVGSILKWEGIIIDPIGAILAVLVFQVIIAEGFGEGIGIALVSLLQTVVIDSAIGIVGAVLVVVLVKGYWIPDYLHSTLTLALVIAAFAISNLIHEDSGLLAVTVMGIILANQNQVSVRHIAEFKENLRVLLISSLFILLAARLNGDMLKYINVSSLIFVAVLILLARPVAVALSTIRSNLNWNERLFLACLAPRGIVAASVASIFALRLEAAGFAQSEMLVPVTFIVISVTVIIYGLSASPLGHFLKIAQSNPQGLLIIGAHPWARTIATALDKEGYKVLIVDSKWSAISKARMEGIPTFYANILSQYALEEIDLGGIGRMLALTDEDEFNSLAILQFANVLGSKEVYQLCSESEQKGQKELIPRHMHGRRLFGRGITYNYLSSRFDAGAVVKTTSLTPEFDYQAFKEYYGKSAIPLFLIDGNGKLTVFTRDNPLKPQPGQKVISLISPQADNKTTDKGNSMDFSKNNSTIKYLSD